MEFEPYPENLFQEPDRTFFLVLAVSNVICFLNRKIIQAAVGTAIKRRIEKIGEFPELVFAETDSPPTGSWKWKSLLVLKYLAVLVVILVFPKISLEVNGRILLCSLFPVLSLEIPFFLDLYKIVKSPQSILEIDYKTNEISILIEWHPKKRFPGINENFVLFTFLTLIAVSFGLRMCSDYLPPEVGKIAADLEAAAWAIPCNAFLWLSFLASRREYRKHSLLLKRGPA